MSPRVLAACACVCFASTLSAAPDAARSAAAVEQLRAALAKSADLADAPFARVPLTKADAAAARSLLWQAHADAVRKGRADESKARVVPDGKLEMPYSYKTFGKKPKAGWSLFVSLHGGGNAAKKVNDQQWENQKRLYSVEEGIYLAPRAPTNTWNLWHEAHVDRMLARLIESLVAAEGVDPDRVYLLGYSAGGDGVYQLAPRMADHWAAAAMMAGHPNGVSPLSLRNVPFALQVGGDDSAYGRNKVAREYGEQLARLRKDDPKGYEHFVKVHEGRGHWMNLEDKAALPWMAKYTRDPVPAKVVWKQTGPARERSYWLAVPRGGAKAGSLVVASRSGQRVDVGPAEGVAKLLVRLDDRMADLDRAVEVRHKGKVVYEGVPSRTMAVMLATLAGRGDPSLVFDAEVEVALAE